MPIRTGGGRPGEIWADAESAANGESRVSRVLQRTDAHSATGLHPSFIYSFIHSFFSFIYLHQTAGPYQVKQTTKETHAQHTQTSKMEHKSLRTQWHHSRFNSIITSQRNVFKTTGKIMHYMRTTPAGPILRNFSGCTISKVHVWCNALTLSKVSTS